MVTNLQGASLRTYGTATPFVNEAPSAAAKAGQLFSVDPRESDKEVMLLPAKQDKTPWTE